MRAVKRVRLMVFHSIYIA